MMAIDIGADAIDRANAAGNTVFGLCLIEGSNPASEAGKILKVYIYFKGGSPTCSVGIFRHAGGNVFNSVDHQDVGVIADGLNEKDVDLDCEIGDYIGILYAAMPSGDGIDTDVTGAADWWRTLEATSFPYINYTFTNTPGRIISLYGEIIVSTAAPSVTTQAVSDIDKTTATGNGTVVSLGVPLATQHGHCWATYTNPTTTDSKTENGVPSATGAYTSSMTGLKANTKYYVRAYITNSVGTFYGTQVEFWTLPDVPLVTTYLAKSVAATTALGSGNIDNNGGSAISQHGVLWRAGADPDIDTYDGKTELGATTFMYFESLMTSLTVGTEYHYRAYAFNADNPDTPGYGSVLKFTTSAAGMPIVKTRATINITPTTATGRGVVTDTGGSPITAYGHCYKAVTDPPTVPTTSDSTKETTGAPTIDEVFLSEITVLTAGTSYILAAYATNTQGTSYGDPVNINEVADESKGQIAYQGEHLLYTTKSGKQRRLLGAEF